ncbi:glycosyltransferase family 9 protein [Candidatus Neptunichlamydia sp. REUL1]|uniref:glycosyltransferase family 9 protein n=1 Tax=Candidatus Neptunichlamydia sp. REUL1 TaxID=3064277 RepID=UPI00292CC5B1|nr:glycosyltransferase family 9 protein [Candidatus Neptunochlamydia sp. REUL1]
MKAAVICSKGMGDGLMMMVASHRLKLEGYDVTTFQDSLGELEGWFPGHHFAKRSTIDSLEAFDLIVLQNDNTPFSSNLIDKYREKIYIFYASYEEGKHHAIYPQDRIFDRALPLVTNIAQSIASILGNRDPILENGITVPKELSYRKHQKRVVIHPTSTTPKRTWSREKFLGVAEKLEKEGFEIAFSLSHEEKEKWRGVPFAIPEFPNLSSLASYLYESYSLIGNESGTGHLASNLGIPTLIVASCPKQMALWRPGFLLGKIVTPPSYIPNTKLFRLRENRWQAFISSRRVVKTFHEAV